MKISLARDALLSQLQTVTRVASTRSAIQALSGVQLSASGGTCELRATDTDVSLRVPLQGQVERDGSVVLPARLLLDVVRSLPAAEVTLELRPAHQDVELISGNATFDIRTLHAEDFPPFPEPDPSTAVSLPAEAFVATALKVAGSASRDETRPVLTGILVSASGNDVRMVATDSYRLSVKETTLESSLSSGFEVNVPARALQELARIAAHAEDEELRDVVRRISLLAQKNAPLRLAFQPGELTVSAQTPDIGEARESLPVSFQGESLEIGFNPEFLRDGLDAIEEGDVLVKLISPLRPGLLEAADDSGFLYLIMPIRLNV